MSRILPVIMCGGSGTRLWPLSRRLEPKQFQKLVGDSSLFQDTLQRFGGSRFGRPTVLLNAAHEARVWLEFETMSHPHGIPQIVVEPAIRSTAPAVAAAAIVAAEDDPGAIMLVMPSDHRIGRPERLLDACVAAIPFVEAGGIALFGIRPTAPEIGFGYIRAGSESEHGVSKVEAFIEKPDIERATQLIADPRHTWNSGIFMFRAATILEELARFAPAVLDVATAAVTNARRRANTVYLAGSYGDAPEISLDHAVMEHSRRLGVLPVSPDWNDVGSFEALWEVSERNGDENVILGEAVLKDVRRSYIRASRRLVSIVGLSNIVVVDTDDALLVASRAQSQDVKHIAQHLARNGHPAADEHVEQQRPGGTRRIVEGDRGYRVEHLTVLPGRDMRLDVLPVSARRILTVFSGEATIAGDLASMSIGAGESYAPLDDFNLTIRNESDEPAEILVTITFIGEFALAGDQASQQKVS